MISDKAYEKLTKLKKRNESFSDVVIKLTEIKKKKSIMHFAGKNDKEIEKIFEKILYERHKTLYKEKDVSW